MISTSGGSSVLAAELLYCNNFQGLLASLSMLYQRRQQFPTPFSPGAFVGAPPDTILGADHAASCFLDRYLKNTAFTFVNYGQGPGDTDGPDGFERAIEQILRAHCGGPYNPNNPFPQSGAGPGLADSGNYNENNLFPASMTWSISSTFMSGEVALESWWAPSENRRVSTTGMNQAGYTTEPSSYKGHVNIPVQLRTSNVGQRQPTSESYLYGPRLKEFNMVYKIKNRW